MSIDPNRILQDINALAAFNATPNNGVTRFTYTPQHKAAQQWLVQRMQQAGLTVQIDPVGVVVGRLSGKDPSLAAVATGSHYDTVGHGGRYDGIAGVVAGLEVARALQEEGFVPQRPVEFIATVAEEGSRFGHSLFSSQAMAGLLQKHDLADYRDSNGITIEAAMAQFGLDPAQFTKAKRAPGSLRCFLELHIEQGPVLDHTGEDVGIVEAIVGMKELTVTITGKANHAGATPMYLRSDALLAACRMALAAEEAAIREQNGTVATVGSLQVEPGGFNIVPGRAVFTLDIRSVSEQSLERVSQTLLERLAQICHAESGLSFTCETKVDVPPVKMDPSLRQLLTEQAAKLGLSARQMPSGAGHDAQMMATFTPTAMIFVPSQDGRSHCPQEYTSPLQLANGTKLLYAAIQQLSGR